MQARIIVDMDNDAFDLPGSELVRVLYRLVSAIEQRGLQNVSQTGLLDSNGNKVGTFTVSD